MTRFLLFSLTIVLCLASVRCQEGEGGGGFWDRLFSVVRRFFERLRKLWDEMKEEIKARTSEINSWTKEGIEIFRSKMKDWINSRSDASDSEKEDMRRYIERLQISTEPPKRRK